MMGQARGSSLLAECAPSEGSRSTRAFEDRPGHPPGEEGRDKFGGGIRVLPECARGIFTGG
jgi:hypothetical protein